MERKKVLVAGFSAECNEHVTHQADIGEFRILYGQESIEYTQVRDIFEDNEVELVPSIIATTSPTGMIRKEAFDYITDRMLTAIKENLGKIDAIYLLWHGASGVVDLPEISGEHYLIKEIRKIVGKHLPITITMDPHGNVTEDLTKYCTIVRTYRESPHSDAIDTRRIVAEKLVDLLKNRRPMKTLIRKLPIMVGGERSISAYEPIKSINRLMDEAEEDPRIFSLSYFVGFLRHDDDKLGAAVVAVPNTTEDIEYTEKIMDEISEYAWKHRHEFKFRGNYDEPEDAVRKAIEFEGKTAVITDSGDNCGAGSQGKNTIILREFLKQDSQDKNVLIAGLNDHHAHPKFNGKEVGDELTIAIGENIDQNSKPVQVTVKLKNIGKAMYGNKHIDGIVYVVNVVDTNIDIILMDVNVQYGQMMQYHAAGVEFHDYDIVVVKMGYLDTPLIPETAYHNMALTDGPTIQRSEKLPYKQIARPMWPIDDDMETLYYIE